MMKSTVLECREISKSYDKKNEKKVLEKLNLKVNEGEIFGLLGLNGAGKTTLIRIISGILRQDSGEVFINGNNIKESDAFKKN